MPIDDKELNKRFDSIQEQQIRQSHQLQALTNTLQRGQPVAPQPTNSGLPRAPAGNPDPNAVLGNLLRVNPQAAIEAITDKAAQTATLNVLQEQGVRGAYNENVKNRMERLMNDYPALSDDDAPLTTEAKKVYARVSKENPGLDEPTRYEIAIREAASRVGAVPVSVASRVSEDDGWTMGGGRPNPAVTGKKRKANRLTPAIVMNAKLMGVDVDPKTEQGKKNLLELNENSARFNADRDDSSIRYK